MVPFIINNRNRLTTLKHLLNWLDGLDVRVIILDNESTYPPLLEFYKTLPFQIVYLQRNMGHTALYKWKEHLKFKERYFVYSDSDILPKENCPKDLIEYLLKAKINHPHKNKIGIGLEVNDIPDCYAFKNEVLAVEAESRGEKRGEFFYSKIDTTLAMYDNQNIASRQHCLQNCLRTDAPYLARHLPWYSDSKNLSKEEQYYITHATAVWRGLGATLDGRVGQWTQKMRLKMIKKIF